MKEKNAKDKARQNAKKSKVKKAPLDKGIAGAESKKPPEGFYPPHNPQNAR